MNINSDEFQQFLHQLGVEMENSVEMESDSLSQQAPELLQEEPSVTMFQQSREYQAFYQLNLIQAVPQLRIVVPEKQGQLKFQIYLVQLSDQHPLSSLFPLFSRYMGSSEFEGERDAAEWHLLYAIGEMMKDLFWAGIDTSRFPPEIAVQRLV